MATRRTQNTAFGAGTMKAIEQHVDPDQRLFDDPLAGRLLTGPPAVLVRVAPLRKLLVAAMGRIAPGLVGGMVCRTRAVDDATAEALPGVRQVVIIGAGLDTRPYRLAGLDGLPVWELDLPEVQAAKRAAIGRVLGAPPANVRYVPVDLETRPLPTVLAEAGFDATVPALLIWEGVCMYLRRSAVDEALAFAGSLPGGSRLVFTYLPEWVLTSPKYASLVRRMHWKTGFPPDSLAAVLSGYGLSLLDDAGPAEYEQRYLAPRHRTLPVFEIERCAVAAAGDRPL
ncbi:class I SAM-dependent methyltransferase [Rugosimonospora africana]|uniref:S-adenosyl-L-methionine-dependent methyltransferase n=1 Tax=Rugosimonospora africana TaxID=556532 RepID=A0A8J3VT97_9ACTN|nr:SAM-dependent methyltransferase [Rugosimonospora africana]GIH17426.1 S-adenosyl-L-methionine-dependent methyltransferase [Rugosimonospora africana]